MPFAEDLARVMPERDAAGTVRVIGDEEAVPILRQLALLKQDKIKNQVFDAATTPVYLWDDPQRFITHWRNECQDMAIVVRWDAAGQVIHLRVLQRLGLTEVQSRWFIGTVLTPEPPAINRAMYDLGIRRVVGRVNRHDATYLARLRAIGREIKITGADECWSITHLDDVSAG